MKKYTQKYQCQKCKKKFTRDFPGPIACAFCGHLYVDWLNWEAFINSLGNYGRA
jgi:rRNA maturation endonuclease Nob1